MNKMTIFKNENFGEVRTVLIDDIPYFVGKDVAEILGYERPTKATVEHVDTDDRIMISGETQSRFRIELGQRGGWLINESGLYSLILSSKMPNAKKFKRWVTGEVLPQIRKTGSYSTMPKSYPEALRLYADEVEKREKAELEMKKAIREKSRIGTHREATAMNLASQKTKEVNKLKVKLDLEMSYATVKKVEKITGRKYDWQALKKYCESAGLGWNKAFDANYGSVNSYPAEAWKNVYGVTIYGKGGGSYEDRDSK